MKRLRIDANVLLRFLTGEPEDEVLLILSSLVVAEIVWVLKWISPQ